MNKERYAKIVKLAQPRDFEFAPDLREALRECLAELEKYDMLKSAAEEVVATWVDNERPGLRIIWLNKAGVAQFERLEVALKRLDI